MKLFRLLATLLSLALVSPVFPVIIDPVPSMQEVHKHVDLHLNDGSCWVVWDPDNTVMDPANKDGFGGDLWFAAKVKTLTDQGITYVDAVAQTVPNYFAIQAKLSMKPVEDHVVTLIDLLQKKNVVVIGLTARSGPLVTRSIEQLNAINISFSKTTPQLKNPLTFDHLKFPVEYNEGILFCHNNAKGDVLKTILGVVEQQPKKIIFVDDREKHVACVEKAGKALGIEVVGLRYSYLDEAVKNYVLPTEVVAVSSHS